MKKILIGLLLAGAMVFTAACGGATGGGTGSDATKKTGDTEFKNGAHPETALNDSKDTDKDGGETTDANGVTKDDDDTVWSAPGAGITLTEPKSFVDAKGGPEGYGGLFRPEAPDGVVYFQVLYRAMTREEYDQYCDRFNTLDYSALADKEEADDFVQLFNEYTRRVIPLFSVYGIDGNRGKEELNDYLTHAFASYPPFNELIAATTYKEIASAGDYTYYLATVDPKVFNNIYDDNLGDYKDDYHALAKDTDTFLDSLTFYEPVTEAKDDDGILDFSTKDLQGNHITSTELFSKNKVTMVYLWAPWVTPCVAELPHLESMSEEFAKKDCGILGVMMDSTTPTEISEGKDVLKQSGATFPNVLAPENADEILPCLTFPTSYFVDSTGKLIGDPVVGAGTSADEYVSAMEQALSEAEQASSTPVPLMSNLHLPLNDLFQR